LESRFVYDLELLCDDGVIDRLLDLAVLIRHSPKHSDSSNDDATTSEKIRDVLLHCIGDFLLFFPKQIQPISGRYFRSDLLHSAAHLRVHHICQRTSSVPIEELSRGLFRDEGGAGEAHAEADAISALDPDSLVL